MKQSYDRNDSIDHLVHLAECGMLAIETPEEFRDFVRRIREDVVDDINGKKESAMNLAERVAALNPDSGEIGAGRLRDLHEHACNIVA